jgi:hypothetical protein
MVKKISILTGCLLFVISTLVSAADVSFSEKRIRSHVGEQFSLDILMSGFPAIEGGGVTLHYNSDVVRVTSVSVDDSTWNFVNRDGEIDNDAGTVSDILFSNYQGVTGDAKIATIGFESIKKGRSKLTLEESAINPFGSGGENVAVTFKSSTIRVQK